MKIRDWDNKPVTRKLEDLMYALEDYEIRVHMPPMVTKSPGHLGITDNEVG